MFRFIKSVEEILEIMSGNEEYPNIVVMPLVYTDPNTHKMVVRRPAFEEAQSSGVELICYIDKNRNCPHSIKMYDDFYAERLTSHLRKKMTEKYGAAYSNSIPKTEDEAE